MGNVGIKFKEFVYSAISVSYLSFLFSFFFPLSTHQWIVVVVVDRGSWLRFAPIWWMLLVWFGRSWLRFGLILGFVALSSNLYWWMLFFFWVLLWICGSPSVTDFGFCGCYCFLGIVVNLYGSPWVFFFFFSVVVARMDMGLLGWDGRVWVHWIDRWVWVTSVFFQWWWMGWVWVCYIEKVSVSLLGWERQRGWERKKYNWRTIKKEYLNVEPLLLGVL